MEVQDTRVKRDRPSCSVGPRSNRSQSGWIFVHKLFNMPACIFMYIVWGGSGRPMLFSYTRVRAINSPM